MRPSNARRLLINEVAPRDGLQMECSFVETADKIALIDRLSLLGYAKIEVTSFTSPKAIPALRDAAEVMLGLRRAPGVVYTALIPNARGGERALECGVDQFNLVMSASETHNLANLSMFREQSFSQLAAVIELAHRHGTPVNVSLSCCFGCPMEGEIDPAVVLGLVSRFASLTVQGVTLCDTTGMAYPSQVARLCNRVLDAHPELEVTGHFHNTRAMGLANVLAAVDAGVTRFDASLGGIGGCPYAPGASGNVATEDVVHMLECEGHETGVDLHGVILVAPELERLIGHALASQVVRSGPRLKLHAPPAAFDEIRARATRMAEGRATARGLGDTRIG